MNAASEQRLFEALATITRAFADGGVPSLDPAGAEAAGPADPSPAIDALNPETREVLGEAALAVAFGAFASRGGDGGTMHTLIAALGLMAIQCGEEPDPPAEILAIAAEDGRVEEEIDRAGEALDEEFGKDAAPDAVIGALEARILGTAVTLAGCTMPDGPVDQGIVRLRAARALARLAAGMMAMSLAGRAEAALPAEAAAPAQPAGKP